MIIYHERSACASRWDGFQRHEEMLKIGKDGNTLKNAGGAMTHRGKRDLAKSQHANAKLLDQSYNQRQAHTGNVLE